MKKEDLIEKGTYLIEDTKYYKFDTAIEINEKNKANIIKFNDRINLLEDSIDPTLSAKVAANTAAIENNMGEIAYLEGEIGRIDGVVNDLVAETATDVGYDNNGFKLIHDGQEISGQVNKVKINGATYDPETNTINIASGGDKLTINVAKEIYSVVESPIGVRKGTSFMNETLCKSIQDFLSKNSKVVKYGEPPYDQDYRTFVGKLSDISLVGLSLGGFATTCEAVSVYIPSGNVKSSIITFIFRGENSNITSQKTAGILEIMPIGPKQINLYYTPFYNETK